MQQKYEVFISNQAEIDLNRIIDYIEYELLEPMIARNLFLKIKQAMIELERFPYKFPVVESKNMLQQDIRKCKVGNDI